MYDDAGFIAGTQSVVPQDKIDPSVMDVSRIPAYQVTHDTLLERDTDESFYCSLLHGLMCQCI